MSWPMAACAKTRTVKGVGHNAHVEDPVEFARVLGSVGAR